ncbi:MAG: hypothetical protein QXV98_02830 [Thermofilaceae archaeon]
MEDFVKALADRIFEEYKGRRVTLDGSGRPNYSVVYAMVSTLVKMALEQGLDPAAIDFFELIDPELTPEENVSLIARSLRLRAEGAHPLTDVHEEEIHALRGQISELESLLEQATGEERRALEEELERLRRRLRELERKRGAEAARRAAERGAERVGRAARARARRAAEEVRRRAEERRRAKPPPAPALARALTPEEERALLWLMFSTVLRSWGRDPNEYRSDFEAVMRMTEGRPLWERQEVLDRMLAQLRPPPMPPQELVERTISDAVRRLEEATKRLMAAAVPSTPEIARVASEIALPEPAVTVGPCPNAAGLPPHNSVQPTKECVSTMKHIGIHPALIEWWMSCPTCRGFLPGGYLTPSEWVEDVFDRHGLYPAVYKPWFKKLARLKEEAEARR